MREWIVLRKAYPFGMPSIKAKSAADRRPQRGMSYHLTEAGAELMDVVKGLGDKSQK